MLRSEEVARAWFERVWNGKDGDAIEELMADDCVGLAAVGRLTGSREWREKAYEPFVAAIPDIHIEIEDVLAVGDKAVVRWRASGTHTGDGFGVPGTGKPVDLPGITWFRCRDGKVIEGADGYDLGRLMHELGVPLGHTR